MSKDRNTNSHPIHAVFMASARKMRKQKGMTQNDIAEKIGMDQAKYSRLERRCGFTPITMDQAWHISMALESSLLQMCFTSKLESWANLISDARASLENSKQAMTDGVLHFDALLLHLDVYEKMIRSEATEMGGTRADQAALLRTYAAKQIIRNEATANNIDYEKNFSSNGNVESLHSAKVKLNGK